MSRLDQHILNVRNKLTLGVLLQALSSSFLVLAGLLWLTVIILRVVDRTLPAGVIIFGVCAVLTAIGAITYSVIRRPSEDLAAVAIDEKLGLKEKFSTALYARELNDPFARAMVVDAEQAAQNLSLYNRFPLQAPRKAGWAAAVFTAALLTAWLMPPLHLFASPQQAVAKPVVPPVINPAAEKRFKEQLPKIEQAAQLLSTNNDIRKASDELAKAGQTHEGDEYRSKRNALAALQDYKQAMSAELDRNEKFQTAQNDQQMLSTMDSASDESTSVGKAQNQLKAGDLDGAMKNLSKAVADFDKMTPAEQQKMVNQAKQLAAALAKAGNDPHAQQKIAQQLQQMGASASQAQQMAQAMQSAAQGNKQAQQQLQQMAQQMTQQMNNGQGPTMQQQKLIQSLMAKAQSIANSQAQAQALTSSTKQLAQAMQQAQQAKQGQQNKPNQQSAQQQKQQQGQQSQSMAQAQQSMQAQMNQMQAQAKDAATMKAAADAAAQAAADAATGLGNSSGDQSADSGGGDTKAGNKPNPNPANANGNCGNPQWTPTPGKKGGAKMGIAFAPGNFKQELDPSQNRNDGKMLASRFVKAGIDPGHSTAGLRDAAAAAESDAPDEIEQDHVSREAQESVKDYFTAMQKQDGQ